MKEREGGERGSEREGERGGRERERGKRERERGRDREHILGSSLKVSLIFSL